MWSSIFYCTEIFECNFLPLLHCFVPESMMKIMLTDVVCDCFRVKNKYIYVLSLVGCGKGRENRQEKTEGSNHNFGNSFRRNIKNLNFYQIKRVQRLYCFFKKREDDRGNSLQFRILHNISNIDVFLFFDG